MAKIDILDIIALLLEQGVIEAKIKVNLPPGFLTELDKATADNVIEGPELGALIRKYREK